MTTKQLFNKLARKAVPVLLLFTAAAGMSGCATMPPPNQMGPDNIAYIQQGLNFYRQTGASPVNYDACGALQNAVEGGANSSVGTLAGGVVGGVLAHQISRSPLAMVAGILGGSVVGNQIGRNAQGGDINQLNKDCQLQQAISRESGGTVRGGSVTYQPGGLYRRGY